jgi:hypothetical protein
MRRTRAALVTLMLAGVPVQAQVTAAQGELDYSVVSHAPSALFLVDPPPGADSLILPTFVPARVVRATPEPSSPTLLAWHEAAAPTLPLFAAGERVALGGSAVPDRVVYGEVVARRHVMFRPDARGPWRYGWGYLIRIARADQNPSSRFGEWLKDAVVVGVPKR